MSQNKATRGVTLAGNWKMNHGPEATESFFSEIGKSWKPEFEKLDVRIFPPNVSLATAKKNAHSIRIGSQNTHWEEKGAFTGEVSAPQLRELGIEESLVGHSERRQYFGETNETVCKRTDSLLRQGFDVMVCIGEVREERESGQTEAVLQTQLNEGLSDTVKTFLDGRLTIAYEPVWAIGTGLTATPQQAEEAHQLIRKVLWDRFGMEASGRTPILYGGSVKPENIDSLLECPNVDGALVGGASVKPESFLALLEAGCRYI